MEDDIKILKVEYLSRTDWIFKILKVKYLRNLNTSNVKLKHRGAKSKLLEMKMTSN
jgi:hypothetical protein